MHGSPQMAMNPMPLTDNMPLVRDHAAEFHGVAGWPAQPKLVPTVIVCAQPSSPCADLRAGRLLLPCNAPNIYCMASKPILNPMHAI
jgi:hypothetical protein